MLKLGREVEYRSMGRTTHKKVIYSEFLLGFSAIFWYQPIRFADLIEIKN